MFNIFNSTNSWAKKKQLRTFAAETLESTNAFAKETSEDFNLIITDQQTAGKGREKNTWLSPKNGGGLLCSFIFNFAKTPQPLTTALVGLSLYNSLEHVFSDLNWSIKAPNDIWLEDKKIAGILCETLSSGNEHKLIIGLGVNFLSHPNLDTATSIPNEHITEELYINFLNYFLSNLSNASNSFLNDHLAEDHREELIIALNNCPYYTQPILDISPQCDLVFEDKTVNWYSL